MLKGKVMPGAPLKYSDVRISDKPEIEDTFEDVLV